MLPSSLRLDLSMDEFLSGSSTASGLPIAWMLRRLRMTMWMAGLLIGVQTLSALPSGRMSPDRAAPDRITLVPRVVAQTSRMPGSVSPQTSPVTKPRAVLPVGWRRTADGWQHVSEWAAATRSIPLSQHVVAQRNAQPAWLRAVMDSIRQIPPSSFAFAQLASVGLLFGMVNRRKISVMDQTCHSASQ